MYVSLYLHVQYMYIYICWPIIWFTTIQLQRKRTMININSKTHALAFKCRGAQKLRKIRWKHWVFPLAVSFLFKKIQEKPIYFGVCKTLRVTQPCSQLLATTCEQKNIQEYIYFGHTRLTSHPKTLGPESWDIPDIKCARKNDILLLQTMKL